MARISHRIPRLCQHKAKGLAFVCVDGWMIYLGRFGSQEANSEYNRIVAELVAPRPSRPEISATKRRGGDLTISELCLAYQRLAELYYRKEGQPTSEVERIRAVLVRLTKLFAASLAKDFTPSMLKVVRDSWIEDRRARKSINQCCGIIRRCFKWGIESELVTPTVLAGLQAVAPLKHGRSNAVEAPPTSRTSRRFSRSFADKSGR